MVLVAMLTTATQSDGDSDSDDVTDSDTAIDTDVQVEPKESNLSTVHYIADALRLFPCKDDHQHALAKES
jgi:hypothetical protein